MTEHPPGKFSIRKKMTLAALAPLVVILVLVSFAASYLINAWVVGETQKKVRTDLNAAREVLHHMEGRVLDLVRFTAHSAALVEALASKNAASLEDELSEIRRREGLDLLTLVDTRGQVLFRASKPTKPGQQTTRLPFVAKALEGGDYSGIALLPGEELAKEGGNLAELAKITRHPSAGNDRPGVEDRGMALVGASAIHDERGVVLGCLYGGILLNNNLTLVDRIKELVYGKESFQDIEIGSATIFLEDLRIATTIRLKDGRRALGTQVSPEVAEAVLTRGQPWVARARVVDEWYLTAYEPIFDLGGKAIGALYVGLLEQPFSALKSKAWLILLALLMLGWVLGGLLAGLVANRLSRPILTLASTAERIAGGELDVALPVAGQDEVGHLTDAFNRMSIALKERDEELQSLNQELEKKVEERTAQLEEKSLQLIRAQEELLRSEKLAAIGSLAAGVAHEINNPAAIIRGNVEILLMELGPEAPGREEAEEILKQTERVSLITRNMLTFAREQTIHAEEVQINDLLGEILDQIGHQVSLGTVKIIKQLDPQLPVIEGDRERLRQVFTNMVANALQAMAGEGTLTVSSRLEDGTVVVGVGDTGPGIPEELHHKIFNPFFTTKKTGTGLGLSVSYGIVKALNGAIEVQSQSSKGALFLVRLPLGSQSGQSTCA